MASDRVWTLPANGQPATWRPPSGGSQPAGVPIVRAFPVVFNTPNISSGGASIYTPTIGDVLLDAWVQIDTPWDGTTPQGDFGTFATDNFGWFGGTVFAVDMTKQDSLVQVNGLQSGHNNMLGGYSFFQAQALNNVVLGISLQGGAGPGLESTPGTGSRDLPAKFISTAAIKFVVSQNGASDGADPGSTQGAAVLYLVTATPAT